MSDSVVIATDLNFKKEVSDVSGLVMVDFYADWCGPCKMTAPIMEQLASEYAGKVKVAKLNVDEAPNASMFYKATHIPTILIFKDGKEIVRSIGAKSKRDYSRILDEALGVPSK